ncbi:regular [Carabus blaptoides fortunei]
MLPSVSMFEPEIKVVPLGFYESSTRSEPHIENGEQPAPSENNSESSEQQFNDDTLKNQSTSRGKPQACKVCGKMLSSASSYYVHMKLHSGTKPFQCTICDAAFCRNGSPLACEQCKMTFPSKNQFAIHIKTHSTTQNHECHICGRSFVRDSYLIRHQNRVHGGNNNSTVRLPFHFIHVNPPKDDTLPATITPVPPAENKRAK